MKFALVKVWMVMMTVSAAQAEETRTTVPKLDKAEREAIVEEANRTICTHLESDLTSTHLKYDLGQRPGKVIAKDQWGEAIARLKPIRVREDRVNVAIVLQEKDGIEAGLYVISPISSVRPRVGDPFLEFKKLGEPDDKCFGQLYYYQLPSELLVPLPAKK